MLDTHTSICVFVALFVEKGELVVIESLPGTTNAPKVLVKVELSRFTLATEASFGWTCIEWPDTNVSLYLIGWGCWNVELRSRLAKWDGNFADATEKSTENSLGTQENGQSTKAEEFNWKLG